MGDHKCGREKKKVLIGREGHSLPSSVESNCGKTKVELRAVRNNESMSIAHAQCGGD